MEKKVTLTLTVDQVNLVLAGLGELPAKMSKGLIDQVLAESKAQLEQTTEPVK